MLHMLQTVFAVFLLAAAARAACPYPNGTETAVNMFSCGNSADTISITSYKLTDAAGKEIYPITPSKPFVLDMQSFNAGPEYTDVKASVRVFEYQKSWSTGLCGWSEIPTFGVLDNIDACDFASNCPWQHGELDLNMLLDFSPYSNIISMLSKDAAVQLQLTLNNYSAGSKRERIACIIGQMRIQ